MRSAAAARDGGQRPLRILIVDDHEVSRAVLRALLRTEGVEVADVRTGDAAIAAAIAFRPGTAIVDVRPGDAAGFVIASRLRSLPDGPAVVLTSSASRSHFGPELGNYRFVAKADVCAGTVGNLTQPAASPPAGP
jgi:CheY-like chemotaxis protein